MGAHQKEEGQRERPMGAEVGFHWQQQNRRLQHLQDEHQLEQDQMGQGQMDVVQMDVRHWVLVVGSR